MRMGEVGEEKNLYKQKRERRGEKGECFSLEKCNEEQKVA
jgi:hypothetical protein